MEAGDFPARRLDLPWRSCLKKIRSFMKSAKAAGLYPSMVVTKGLSSEPEVNTQGYDVVSFASANYLGLANDARVKQSVIDGIERYGLHPGASRCISGTLDIHRELEQRVAAFKGTEDAMLFQTGMLANTGAIPAIVDMPLLGVSSVLRAGADRRKNVIFTDEFNHACIVDGGLLSRAEVVTYKHSNMEDLAAKMEQHRGYRALVVSDGLFSMDGDIARLPELVELAGMHDAMLMVDDAHATGVLGEHGKGTLEHYGLVDGVVRTVRGEGATHAERAAAESASTPRDLEADGAESDNADGPALDLTRHVAAIGVGLLVEEDGGPALGEHQHRADHPFGDRAGGHASGRGEGNVADQ